MARKLTIMLALVISTQHCMATSYNLDQFTVLEDSMSPSNIHVSSGFVVYTDMNGGIQAYDLEARQSFTIIQTGAESMSLDSKGGFVIWKAMTDSSLYGYDLLKRQQFTIAQNNVDAMAIGMSEKYVVWRDMSDGYMQAYDLTTHEAFTASMMPVESMKPLIAGNF